MQTKPFYQSKTFWANTVAFLLAMITLVANTDFIGIEKQVLLFIESTLTAFANFYLRTVTDTPLEKVGKTLSRAIGNENE